MTQYQQSPLNKYMYNEFENTERQEKNQEESQHGGDKEQNNDYIKVGGYPIQQLILGGNNDRFKNLVVPAGLVMDDYSNDNYSNQNSKYNGGNESINNPINKEPEYSSNTKNDKQIDDELFEKLFGIATIVKKKQPSREKDLSREKNKRKTQKKHKDKFEK